MKYRIGDKVKIRTWKSLEKEFGLSGPGIDCQRFGVLPCMEDSLVKLECKRILTIKGFDEENNFYTMEEISYIWTDEMIRELVKRTEAFEPILTRFEILDIR